MQEEQKKIFLLDVSAFLFRSFYALPPMTSPQGEPTGAIYGFARSLFKLFEDYPVKYIAAVFDGKNNKKKRQAIYSEYKAQRKPTPEELIQQIPLAEEFCRISGIPVINIEEEEADDVIASICSWVKSEDGFTYICTGDKDLLQLVDPATVVLQTHKNNLILDEAKVDELYGVSPSQITDWLAITGDSADNVPGLPGMGPKTATKLLQEFDSLEGLLNSADKVAGAKKQETIRNFSDQARMSYELVKLNHSVPFKKEWSEWRVTGLNAVGVKDFCQRFGLKSLTKSFDKLQETQSDQGIEPVQETLEGQLDLFSLSPSKTKSSTFTLEALDHWDPFYKALAERNSDTLGFSVLLSTENLFKQVPWTEVSFSIEDRVWVGQWSKLDWEKVVSEGVSWVSWSSKFIDRALSIQGLTLPKWKDDLSLLSYLMTPEHKINDIESAVYEYQLASSKEVEEYKELKKRRIKEGLALEDQQFLFRKEHEWMALLSPFLNQNIDKNHLDRVYSEIELPLARVLAQVENNGIYLNIACLETQNYQVKEKIDRLKKDIYSLAEEEFNLNSPKQVGYILFEKLELTPPKKTKTGYSTSAKVLEELVDAHPIIDQILQYRLLEKLRSTYLDALPSYINPITKRIHPDFDQIVTATGRLACHNPNLQNIPIRTEEGRKIRDAFEVQENTNVLVSADYSQIELRVLAHLSHDEHLLEAFLKGEDIHKYTASLVFDIPLEEVDKTRRYQAKAVNFGIIYGQQAFGLSQQLNIPVSESREFIKAYFMRYPKVAEYIARTHEESRQTGISNTLMGRKRKVPEIQSSNKNIQALGERLSINTPIQGTAADLMKCAMISIQEKLNQSDLRARMLLQVHDELIFECKESDCEALCEIVKQEMEGVMELKVPLEVNISVGKNWGAC